MQSVPAGQLALLEVASAISIPERAGTRGTVTISVLDTVSSVLSWTWAAVAAGGVAPFCEVTIPFRTAGAAETPGNACSATTETVSPGATPVTTVGEYTTPAEVRPTITRS